MAAQIPASSAVVDERLFDCVNFHEVVKLLLKTAQLQDESATEPSVKFE